MNKPQFCSKDWVISLLSKIINKVYADYIVVLSSNEGTAVSISGNDGTYDGIITDGKFVHRILSPGTYSATCNGETKSVTVNEIASGLVIKIEM